MNRRGTIGFDTLPFKYLLILICMFDTEFFLEHLWTLSFGFQPNSPKSPVLWLKWYADCSWSGDFCASERVQWCTIHVFWRSEIADHLMGHWFILHSNFWSLIGLKHPHWNGSKVYTLGSSNLAIEHPLWYVCVYIYIYTHIWLVVWNMNVMFP